jgi:hypothetical protein
VNAAADPTLNGTQTVAGNGVVVDLDAAPRPTAPVGQVELFRLDGVVHTIPEKARFNVALKYLWLAKTKGEEIAGQWMLEELIGTDAYTALMDHDELTDAQFSQIMGAAQRVVLGSLESGKG